MNVAGFQTQASNPVNFQVGVPTRGMIQGDTIGGVAFTDMPIAKAAFFVNFNPALNNSVQATNSGGLQFAGVTLRSNSNADTQFYTQGYSQIVPAGQNVQILERGSVPVYIAVANEAGGIPLAGSVVWAMNDGSFQTQVFGTNVANGYPTNFRVQQVQSGAYVAAQTPVVITNNQNMGQ